MKSNLVTDKYTCQMKKLTVIIVLLSIVLYACTKDEPLAYNTTDNIYFDFTPDNKDDKSDSIVYSFAYNPEKDMDTILIPVRLSGIRQKLPRKFSVGIVDTATTAIASLHYQALEREYTIPADSGTFMLPLIVFSKDTALKTKSVIITLSLEASLDLGISFKDLRRGFIKLSNKLEKPVWWDVWSSELQTYSRVKHELFIRTSGTTVLPPSQADYMQTPKALYFIRRFKSFLQDPFKWVADYAEEGYVITQGTDGNYYFYSSGSPENKYLLEKNVSDGKYYFKDEDGNRII
jgi:hypothetical protein